MSSDARPADALRLPLHRIRVLHIHRTEKQQTHIRKRHLKHTDEPNLFKAKLIWDVTLMKIKWYNRITGACGFRRGVDTLTRFYNPNDAFTPYADEALSASDFHIKTRRTSQYRIKIGYKHNISLSWHRTISLIKKKTCRSPTDQNGSVLKHCYRFHRVLFSAVNTAIHYLTWLSLSLHFLIIVTAGWKNRRGVSGILKWSNLSERNTCRRETNLFSINPARKKQLFLHSLFLS